MSETEETAEKAPKTEPRKAVKLKRPHTHGGVHYGEKREDGSYGEIQVTARQQRFLSERGII